jgi:predicted ester cyclase
VRWKEVAVSNHEGLLTGLFAAGDAGDLDSFDRYLHDDVVVHAPSGLSTVGLQRERESWRQAKMAMPDLHHEFIDVISGPGVIAARTVVTGTMRGSYGGLSADGRSFKVDQAVFAHIRDDKIAELWEIVDVAGLREQLGGPG